MKPLLLLPLGFALLQASADPVRIGEFSQGVLEGWQVKPFSGLTLYRIQADERGKLALFARSEGVASGLFRPIDIDLRETPFLRWRWRVDQGLAGN